MIKKDTRSWKCLLWLHQWRVLDHQQHEYYDGDKAIRPYEITTRYRLQCIHCGMIKHLEIGSQI